jgi:prepilin-type processing-associated H-X9-DG protein
MKINVIRYSMIVLLIGLAVLASGRANAQRRNEIIIESYSWGLSSGQAARVSVVNFVFLDGSVRSIDPAIARIQLLDTEGEVIAQSDEIRVSPGQTRFWDVPRELLPAAGDPTGRIQLRTRILVTTTSIDVDRNRPPLSPSVELIDPGTGRTVMGFNGFANFGDIKGETE